MIIMGQSSDEATVEMLISLAFWLFTFFWMIWMAEKMGVAVRQLTAMNKEMESMRLHMGAEHVYDRQAKRAAEERARYEQELRDAKAARDAAFREHQRKIAEKKAKPKRFRVTCTDEATNVQESIEVEAKDYDTAYEQAKQKGVIIDKVEEIEQ